jgi:hypothetical protein
MYHFSQFFSLDSPKAIKARSFGYLNAINYMSPHTSAGVGDLCGDASRGCIDLCLGLHSGQAGMVAEGGTNAVRESRKRKSIMFMRDRRTFLRELEAGIDRAIRAAARLELSLCVRLNGATDLNWLGHKLSSGRNAFETYPAIQFIDYTKNLKRMLAFCAGKLPPNYHLSFSRSETNENDCRQVLAAGGNVAVVFAGEFPETYLGAVVINGDEHDLRHLDPEGVVIGLSPKGNRAKKDRSGFVVRFV